MKNIGSPLQTCYRSTGVEFFVEKVTQLWRRTANVVRTHGFWDWHENILYCETDITVDSAFYKRFSLNLISLAILCLLLIYGKSILLPFLFAVLFANLLLPVNKFLEKKKFGRLLSIFMPLTGGIVVIGVVVFLLSNQVGKFFNDLPALRDKSTELLSSAQQWIDEHAHMSVPKQNQYVKEGTENLKEQAPKIVGFTFASLFGILTYVILIPLYTFLLLLYKKTIKEFLVGVFKNGSTQQVNEVLEESTEVAHKYMVGLLVETMIVFTLNVTGFLILGIKYPVFLALLAAILNVIPYVGILAANVICMLVTLVSSDNISDVVWVGVILGVVQLFDNNVGMPMIVGNRVRINALVTILGVLIGGALCGVPGMFLAIPGLAVLKIIFDKVPELNPYGVLLGDEQPPARKRKLSFHRTKQKVAKSVN
jgi:predicted PurR-regulated permease PerM